MGWFSRYVEEPIQGVIDDIRGKDQLDAAEARREIGDSRLDEQYAAIQRIQAQFDQVYSPIISQQADRLQQGPRHEEYADRARDEFTRNYDASLQESRNNRRRAGLDPTSVTAARYGEDEAFNRALGSAVSANNARTEEDDRHWARSLSFAAGGSGLQQQVASALGGQANANYGVAADHVEQAGAGLQAFGRLAGSAFSALGGRPPGTENLAPTDAGGGLQEPGGAPRLGVGGGYAQLPTYSATPSTPLKPFPTAGTQYEFGRSGNYQQSF